MTDKKVGDMDYKVVRYWLRIEKAMEPDSDGHWVRYSDYAKLNLEVAKRDSRIGLLEQRERYLEDERDKLAERVRELESEVDAQDLCNAELMAVGAKYIGEQTVASLKAEIARLREALERARPYIIGYKMGSERNLEWWDEALEASDE
jgi:sugar phosphate isomerase/epimerase